MQTANIYVPPHLRKHYAEQMRTRNASPDESSSEEDGRTSSRSSSEHSSPDKKIEEMKRAARLRIEREHATTAAKSIEEPPPRSMEPRLECNVMRLVEREDGTISAKLLTMATVNQQHVKPNTAEDTSVDDIAQSLGSFTLTASEDVASESKE